MKKEILVGFASILLWALTSLAEESPPTYPIIIEAKIVKIMLEGGEAEKLGLVSKEQPAISPLEIVTSSGKNYQAVIERIDKCSNIDILATPKIILFENKQFVITVSEQIPIMGEMHNHNLKYVEYEEKKLEIEAIPKMIKDILTLDIRPIVGEKELERKTVSFREGEQVVLLDFTKTTIDRVPLLGNLPLLGYLFKKEQQSLMIISITYKKLSSDIKKTKH